MRVMQEETFGPVLPVAPFDSDEDAIRLANDSEFGLAASVWTRNRRRGEAVAARIKAGTVMLNDMISCFGIAEAPHGGFKHSGIGRTHGEMGLQEMVQAKYVDVDLIPGIRKVWWFGYGRQYQEQMNGLIDMLFARSWGRKLQGALQVRRTVPALNQNLADAGRTYCLRIVITSEARDLLFAAVTEKQIPRAQNGRS